MKFNGELKFPEIDHPGVPVQFVIDGPQAEITVDGESLGRWSLYDIHARRLIASAFQIDLDGTEVTFVAADPIDFAYRGVEHMAESWAAIKAKRMANRSMAIRKSRKGTIPSRIDDLREAMESNLETSTLRPIAGEPSMPLPARSFANDTEVDSIVEQMDAPARSGEAIPATAPAESSPELLEIEEERRRLAEERAALEQERLAAEQREANLLEAYRLEMERLEAEREELKRQAEAAALAAEEAETQARAAETAEDERQAQEAAAAAVLAEQRALEAAAASAAAEQEAAERQAAEQAAEQAAAEREAAEREAAAQEAAARQAAEQAAEQAAAEREAAEREAAEQEAKERETSEREAAELAAAAAQSVEQVPSTVVDLSDLEHTGPNGVSDGGVVQPEPALAGASKDKGGLMGAVKAAFRGGARDHSHQFVEAPGGIGITRYVCEECAYVSISVGS